MKEPFKIVEFNNQLIVFSIDNTRMPEICGLVEKKLAKKEYTGNVVFDLLICNGLSNRYFNVSFDGKFNFSTLKKNTTINKTLSDFTNNFYSKHIDYIKQSILPRTEKQRIVQLVETKELVHA